MSLLTEPVLPDRISTAFVYGLHHMHRFNVGLASEDCRPRRGYRPYNSDPGYLGQKGLNNALAVPEVEQPHALVGEMAGVAGLTERKMNARRTELLLEPEDCRDGASLANLEGFDVPHILNGVLQGLEVWRVERSKPPRRRVSDSDLPISHMI